MFNRFPAAGYIIGRLFIVHRLGCLIITGATDGQNQTLDFHALVIATGASTPSPLFSFKRDENSIREAWSIFHAGLDTAKSIVIAGGGPAGAETAGELGEYLNGRSGGFSLKLETPKVPITLVTSGSHIPPHLRPKIADVAEEQLAKVGVIVLKNIRVTSVEPPNAGVHVSKITSKATLNLSDGTNLHADLFIPATGYVLNTSFLARNLLTPAGQVETNGSTLRVDKAGPRIYAIGDASSFARPAIHNIITAVPVLAANIKRDLLPAAGKSQTEVGADRIFKEDKRETQLVPIGRTKGVGAAIGRRLPSWMVWLIKGRDYWLWNVGSVWNGKQWSKEV